MKDDYHNFMGGLVLHGGIFHYSKTKRGVTLGEQVEILLFQKFFEIFFFFVLPKELKLGLGGGYMEGIWVILDGQHSGAGQFWKSPPLAGFPKFDFALDIWKKIFIAKGDYLWCVSYDSWGLVIPHGSQEATIHSLEVTLEIIF